MKRFFPLFLTVSLLFGITMAHAEVINFEDLSLNDESFWNGSDSSGGFTSNNVFFSNNYDTTWESWDGFSYSNITDTEISGYASQFNAITGEGVNGSSIYVVGYYSAYTMVPPTVTFSMEQKVTGAYFTNNNYAYYSMLYGDSWAKKFEEGDWFKLTITGKDLDGYVTGSVDVFLAEGTDIVDNWVWLDLSILGKVKYLEFTLSSSDNTGEWMNTPAYFCMDNLNIVPSSSAQNNSHDIYSFPGFLGIYPLGSYFGTLNNSLPLGVYMNTNAFFNLYPLAGYPGTSLFTGQATSNYNQALSGNLILGGSLNNSLQYGGYFSGNPSVSLINSNLFGRYNNGVYSPIGIGNTYLMQPSGGYNVISGYPLSYGYLGGYHFSGFPYTVYN